MAEQLEGAMVNIYTMYMAKQLEGAMVNIYTMYTAEQLEGAMVNIWQSIRSTKNVTVVFNTDFVPDNVHVVLLCLYFIKF